MELLKSILLSDFPSGSSINYFNGKLYLIGDDANNILVLNTNYDEVESIPLFDYAEKRIPKSEKVDLETSCIINLDGQDNLLVFGSSSKEKRHKLLLIPLLNSDQKFAAIDTKVFTNRLEINGIKEINIEGSAVISDHLILSNKGNCTNSQNHLIITDKDYWMNQEIASMALSTIKLSIDDKSLGVSELCYLTENDLLLFTVTSEETANAYDDGEIGDSYIGWIHNITEKIHQPEIIVEDLINLSEIDAAFSREKIEGICVESVNENELVMHLISDNDNGQSKLFNVKMRIEGI